MCGRMQRSTPRPGNDGRISVPARVRTTQEVMDAIAWDAAAEETSISRILGRIVENFYKERDAQVHSHKVRRVPSKQ